MKTYTLFKGNRLDGEYTATLDELHQRFSQSEAASIENWPWIRQVATWLACEEEAVLETPEQQHELAEDLYHIARQ